jgi:hypothetical protein
MVRLLVGGMTVPLEEARESCVLLIMHGGWAATLAAAGHLMAVVYVVLSAQHPGCHYTTVTDAIITLTSWRYYATTVWMRSNLFSASGLQPYLLSVLNSLLVVSPSVLKNDFYLGRAENIIGDL